MQKFNCSKYFHFTRGLQKKFHFPPKTLMWAYGLLTKKLQMLVQINIIVNLLNLKFFWISKYPKQY
jgi:hypothetical protein